MIEPKKHLSTILNFLVNNFNPLASNNCLLCKSSLTRADKYICSACQTDLPFNTNYCFQCGLPLLTNNVQTTEKLCGECIQTPPFFQRTISPFVYFFPVKQAIKEGKYNNKRYWFDYLTPYITRSIQSHYSKRELPDIILPVPMHQTKLKLRPYNQALIIAKRLSKDLNIKLEQEWLIKVKETESSSLQNKDERIRSLKNAFKLHPEANLSNLHIAVVDDVMTTNAYSH